MGKGTKNVNLPAALTSFWNHRYLIYQMTRREVIGRYKGSFLGVLWALFNPIIMLAVYTFVFSVVFKARWGELETGKAEFSIMLFAGLIVYSLFSECLQRAPTLILSNVNYVKKIVFPLEILCVVVLGNALFNLMISVGVLLVFYLMVHQFLHWTVIFFPLVILPILPLTLGLSWFLASMGVFLRDIREAVNILTAVLMFMSPIFYPITAVSERLQTVLYMNPLAFIIGQVRQVIVFGHMPDWRWLLLYFLISTVIAWIGFIWFQKTRKGFADVI